VDKDRKEIHSLRRRLARSCSQQSRVPNTRRFSRVGVEARVLDCWDAMQRSAHQKFCAAPTALASFFSLPSASALG